MYIKITVEANKYKGGGAWDCNPSYDLEGDKIRANKKVDEDEQIAISMLGEEIIEKLKSKEEK